MPNSEAQNREVVKRFVREGRDPTTGEWNLQVVGEVFDFDRYVSHSWDGSLTETGQRMAAFFSALEFIETIDDAIVAEGDFVVYRATDRVRHVGVLLGVPPTDRVLTLHRVDMWRLSDGRIVEHWGGQGDTWSLYHQIAEES